MPDEASCANEPTNSVAAAAARDALAAIEAQLAELRRTFDEKIRDDASKGELFEKLYADLARYRDDFVFASITRRVLSDVMQLFDRVDTLLGDGVLAGMQPAEIADHVRSFRTEILQMLRRQEVSIVDPNPGSFDETIQEAVDVRPVSRREDDQRVVAVVRRGFRYRGRLLRPESVVVGRFKAVEEGSDDGQGDRY